MIKRLEDEFGGIGRHLNHFNAEIKKLPVVFSVQEPDRA